MALTETKSKADLALKAFRKSLEQNNAHKEEVDELNKQLMRSWEIRIILIADNDCLLAKVKKMSSFWETWAAEDCVTDRSLSQ